MMLMSGLLLALTLAQVPAPAGHQEAPKTDETVPVAKGTRLSINNFAGEVVIHTWDRDSVHVVARHQSRTRVIIKPNAAGLSINASGTMGPQGSVDYDITAPAWMPIKVEGTYNFVTMEGVQGEVFANTIRGDIVIKGGSGNITAKSVEGEVQVEGARGKVNVSSVNEKIRITDTSGEITAESINGAITMSGIDSKSVDASTVNGTIIYEGKLADGGRYSNDNAAKTRAAWKAVKIHAPQKTVAQCKEIIRQWVKSGLLVVELYRAADRKERNGLRVNNTKRPGTRTDG